MSTPRDYWVSGFLAGCEHGAAIARGENPAPARPPSANDMSELATPDAQPQYKQEDVAGWTLREGEVIEVRTHDGRVFPVTVGRRIPYESGGLMPCIELDPKLIEQSDSPPRDGEVS